MSIRHAVKGVLTATKQNLKSPDYAARLYARMQKDGQHHGAEHARWRDWRKDLRDKYRAFAIVRNPWSRTVSRWTFYQHIAENGKIHMPKGYTFRDYLDERHQYGGRPFYWHRAVHGWYPQKDHVTDAKDKVRCDVLRFEHYDADTMAYLKLAQPLQPRNVSNINKLDYRDFYTAQTHDIVAEWYADDIAFFGFTFDGTAMRNVWNTG